MNPVDATIDAGLNIVSVQGLDKARAEISAMVREAIKSGARMDNITKESMAASKGLYSLQEFQSLLDIINSPNKAEALSAALVGRQHLNALKRTPGLSNEALMGISSTTEQLNAITNMYRTLLKGTGDLPTATQALVERRKQEQEAREQQRADAANLRRLQRETSASERAIDRELSIGQNLIDARKRAITTSWEARQEFNKFVAGEGVYGEGSKDDKAYARSALRYQLNEARRARLSAGMWGKFDEAEYQKRIKKIADNSDRIRDGIKKVGGYLAAGATGIAFGNKLSNIAAGYYESQTPFTYLRKTAADVAQYAGGALGAIIGGALGSVLGPGGTVLGAMAGGTLGTWIGGIFNRDQAASRKAKSDVTQMARYSALYPATQGGGWQFAKMAEATTGGMVSAASVEQMAANSQEFAAAMAFGGISESQMLGMTMLPNYYASVMGGESPEQQIAALTADLDGMDPGLAQYAARLAGVPSDMVALARTPALGTRLLGEGTRAAAWVTSQVSPHTGALISAQFIEGKENRKETVNQVRRAAASISRYDYDHNLGPESEYYNSAKQIMGNLGYDPAGSLWRGKNAAQLDGIKDLIDAKDNKVKRELNIYINNEQVATVSPIYTDADIGDYVSFAAGNL